MVKKSKKNYSFLFHFEKNNLNNHLFLFHQISQQHASKCLHKWINDYIDITPDISQPITYCCLCLETFETF